MPEQIITNLSKNTEDNEIYIKNQDIYSIRNNVEFNNIPENIEDDKVEEYILKILKAVEIDISSYDIVAVHRIGKRSNKSRNVIVRFLNRKDAYKALRSNKT